MAYYQIIYTIKNNQYIYPAAIKDAVWKNSIYHPSEHSMVGETDEKIKANGRNVISLKPAAAKRLIKEYQASYSKIPEPPEDFEKPAV